MNIPVNLAVEDELSEVVLRRLLHHADRRYEIGRTHGRRGFGYLKRTIPGWNRAARSVPMVVLTDLDSSPCPSALIAEWLDVPLHRNLLLRIAVREVEAWLLADRLNLSTFLGVSEKNIPNSPEEIIDPKSALIAAARRSRIRQIRERLVPPTRSTAKQGRDYNSCLAEFVKAGWDVAAAASRSDSLRRAVSSFASFHPVFD